MVRSIARQFLACAVVIVTSTSTAWANPPMPLPTAEQLSSLQKHTFPSLEELAASLRAGTGTTRACTLEKGNFVCRCVRREAAGYTFVFGTLREDGTASNVWVEYGDGRLFAAEVVVDSEGLTLDDVFWSDGEVTVRAAQALLTESAQLVEVEWFDEPVAAGACDESPPTAAGAPYARAASVSLSAETWRAEALRVGPWPVGNTSMQKSGSGFLPPTVRASNVGGELQGDYWIAPWGSVLAAVDPTGRLGAGVGITSQRRGEHRRLDLMAYGDLEEGLVPVASGDLSMGEQLHLRGHLEHPSDAHAASLRAFERGALFRSWNASRIGLSLTGDGHALQMRGAVLTDPEALQPQWDGTLTYGATFARQRHSVWRLDLDHRTIEDDHTIHTSTAAVSWRGPFGRKSRAWIIPGADLVANYGTVTARRGFDASTTLSGLASLDTGLMLEGRFGQLRHRIGPRARAGAEAVGVQQRQPEEGAPPYPWTQPDRWRWALLSLHQELNQSGWVLTAPVGLFADAIADETVGDAVERPHGFTRLAARYRDVSVGLAGTCQFPCELPRFHAAAHFAPDRGLRAWYSAGNMGVRELAIAWADLHLDQPLTATRLVQTRGAGSAPASFAHHAGFALRRGRASFALLGNWGDTDASRGVGAEASVNWPELGWGLGVGGGWRPFDGVWNVVAGLSWSAL